MRRVGVVLIVPTLLVVLAPSAHAGGSWMGLRQVDGTGAASDGYWGGWAAPGSIVTMAGNFCDGQQADPSEGPWSAYLRPDSGGPRDSLGSVAIGPASGDACKYVASATFVVPQTAPGVYWVDVCADAACSVGVGDLVGGQFAVATTALEAKLLYEIGPLRNELRRLDRDIRRLRSEMKTLEAELRGARERSAMTKNHLRTANDQLDAISRDRDTAATRLTTARRGVIVWRAIALGAAALALVLGVLLASTLRRRRINVPERSTSPARLAALQSGLHFDQRSVR